MCIVARRFEQIVLVNYKFEEGKRLVTENRGEKMVLVCAVEKLFDVEKTEITRGF